MMSTERTETTQKGDNNMRTFEIGKRYRDGAATFEIIGRTAKTVRFAMRKEQR